MQYESPTSVLRRLKLGREEFCQRLVTTLIVGGTYPRWNSRSIPTAQGVEFLRLLDELSFGEATPPPAEVFVDELELSPRVEMEKGGAPDWAVIWPGRLWMIELKTEAGSHRREQLPYYFELGSHHFPGRPVDITYITGPLTQPGPAVGHGQRYAHLTWTQVMPLVRDAWGSDPNPSVVAYVDALGSVVAGLGVSWADQRASLAPPLEAVPIQPAAPDHGSSVDASPTSGTPTGPDLLHLIEATAADGEQRGVPSDSASLDDVLALRAAARDLILQAPSDSPIHRVMPWLWSGPDITLGKPLTPGGAEHGYEVRLSRYAKAVL